MTTTTRPAHATPTTSQTDPGQPTADPAHAEILPQMDALHDLCWQTDEARLAHRRRP